MSVAKLPLDPPTLEFAVQLGRSKWDRQFIDDVFSRVVSGFADGASFTDWVFEKLETRIRLNQLNQRTLTIVIDCDPNRIVGFSIPFVLCYMAGDDPSDPDFRHFRELKEADLGWQVDMLGESGVFDAAFFEGRDAVQELLGPPEMIGSHGDFGEAIAAWRLGDRLIILAQGEDFATYGLFDQAALWIVEYPSSLPIPEEDDLYDLITSGTSVN